MARRNVEVSELIEYLSGSAAAARMDAEGENRLPTLKELSDQLDVGLSRLREQLEVARSLGLVEVRPRTGIRRLDYSFQPAIQQSLNYAIKLDRVYFDQFSDLRNHIEAAYWHEAVGRLTDEDKASLRELVDAAWRKLRGTPIRIPHEEHRELHLLIFRRLENPFVIGILEAYWEAYEGVGLNLFAEYRYLETVWNYHQIMVDSICLEDYEKGYQALVEHKDLLYHRPLSAYTDEGVTASILAQQS